MKIPSVNISPRVQCGKTAGKTRVSVTQLNSKLHCRDFVRMCTSAPHWVTQIAAGRLDEGNEEKDEVGKEEVEEMKMAAVG